MNINLLITLMQWHYLVTNTEPFTTDEFYQWLGNIYGGYT